MALWQFHIEFIPRAWLEAAAGDISPLFGNEGRDMLPAWREHQPVHPMDELFSGLLKPAPARYAGELYWGSEKRTDAHIWFGHGLVESIGVRVDARNYSAWQLEQIAEIAEMLDCDVLVPESRQVIAPNVFALRTALRASRAARYVLGPAKYLEGAKDGPDEDHPGDDNQGDDGPESA